MILSRRAASRTGVPQGVAAAAKAVIALLGTASALVFASLAVASGHVARLVVTPARRRPDVRITAVDTGAQTITLSRTPDSVLPGRYGLFTVGTESYVKIGSVLAEDEQTVTRKLLTQIERTSRLAPDAAFSGWYFDRPEQLHIPYRSELVGSAVGPCPAWVFPATGEDAGDIWCIQVHGRGTTRAECLRAVPLLHAAGITTMIVSYRNDGEAPRSRSGRYGLGSTEWRDVDAAIGVARRAGARRILLMGWSMGGAVALQVALNSAHRDRIVGLVLDSPVIDWRVVLDYQAAEMKLPHIVRDLSIATLGSTWGTAVTRSGAPIPFARLDVVARAAELRHPVLILHSDDDGFVPADASYRLQEARPDLVNLETFTVARHTKLWNYDQRRWDTAIRDWLAARGFTDHAEAAGS